MASHIGKLPIAVPAGVEVSINGQEFAVKGPKGSSSYTIPDGVEGKVEDNQIIMVPVNDERPTRAKHGLSRSIVASMVEGVSKGYKKHLLIVGTGYRVVAKGKSLEFSLETPNANEVIVSGIDKQAVGQAAANIRRLRAPEPYKGKGIKYADEHIMRKAGKAGK